MQDFLNLDVWHKANRLASDIHRLTLGMRRRDDAVLRGQLQRSSQSIPDTIAEGAGKMSNAEFGRYLDMALGSASETHSQLLRARDRGLVSEEGFQQFADRVTEVRKMLFGLLKRVRGTGEAGPSLPPTLPRESRRGRGARPPEPSAD